MKRANNKIKDFVEPQVFDEVQNYAADLPRALAAYRFTDVTSDLLVRWLDTLADLPRNRGAARALAGLRGVGKSHTLAAFAALAAFPDLRSTISDSYVATRARRLLSRQYTVLRVERGSRETLVEEIAAALTVAFGGDEAKWLRERPSHMLAVAAQMTVDAPVVMVIDTAFGHARVKRDDGPMLSELATATQGINAFIALALDDDIAGADGPNAALVATYQIDYLDPEHLYRIADLHLFRKNEQARAALHELYIGLREAMPGFNWSEPRFVSVYPVHPLVADIAPAVRMYAPTFAFLPFAAAAGALAVNHPALSLIVLDVVFDRAQYELRKSADLYDAFIAYEHLEKEVITQFPVMQRLQAKLVLKGLFILSLDGRGTTARELSAAMLLYDERQPQAAIDRVEETLARFAQSAQSGSLSRTEEGIEARYRFQITATANFDKALEEAASRIGQGREIGELMRVVARSRFEDWPLVDAESARGTDFSVLWRGSYRRGRVSWREQGASAKNKDEETAVENPLVPQDWELVAYAPEIAEGDASLGGAPRQSSNSDALARSSVEENLLGDERRVVWQPAPLSAKDLKVLRRLIALRTDADLLAKFDEATRASERTHAAIAERIWTRIYVDEGTLLFGTGSRVLTDEARAASTLAGALAPMLDGMFAARFAQHPSFAQALDESATARLICDLFGGANQNERGVQELAQKFALPLGLVSLRGELYALEVGDQALKPMWVREVLALTDAANGEVVPIQSVHAKLGGEPYGLHREAQRLVLAALVAGRRIEFITSTGDRISRRTLDLSLKWDDILGIARAATLVHSAEELTEWARLLTGNELLTTIARPESREAVRAALSEWLSSWREQNLLQAFDSLPDESLTTRAWALARDVRKSFESAAETIETVIADTISLEEGLQRITDAFADSTETFAQRVEQLKMLTDFTARISVRERARAYLASSEPTTLDDIESARRELMAIIADAHTIFEDASTERFDLLWGEFGSRYAEHYANMHDRSVGASSDHRAIDILLRSNEWREFEALSGLSIVNNKYWDEACAMLDHAHRMRCELPVRQLLAERPTCYCLFRLSHHSSPTRLAQSLEDTMRRGRDAHRRTLALWSKHLPHALHAMKEEEPHTHIAERARLLFESLAEGSEPMTLSPADAQLIERALQKMAAPALRVSLPTDGLLTRGELDARLRQLLDDLPDYPALVEIVHEGESNAA